TVKAAGLCAGGGLQAAGVVSVRAACLAKGVARAMLWTKCKIALAVLVMGIAGAGAGLTLRAGADTATVAELPSRPVPPPTGPADAEEGPAASHRTANFEVTAPTPETARRVARAAERHRKALALLWLGEEMPAWPRPCTVLVRITHQG